METVNGKGARFKLVPTLFGVGCLTLSVFKFVNAIYKPSQINETLRFTVVSACSGVSTVVDRSAHTDSLLAQVSSDRNS